MFFTSPLSKNWLKNEVSFDSGVKTLIVVDAWVPTILGKKNWVQESAQESAKFLNFDLP